MGKYIGLKTESLVELEKARYSRLLELLKASNSIAGIEANLRNLVTLDRNDYYDSSFDLDKSRFSLRSYQIDNEVFAYDYEINFVSSSQDNYYRSIILTYLNIQPLWDKVYKIDEKFKVESMVLRPSLDKTTFSGTVIDKTISNVANNGMPYIIYGATNIGLGSHWQNNPKIRPFVKYYGNSGQYICHMVLDNPEECVVISGDGVLESRDTEKWCATGFHEGDDPTKIVEMAGYYKSAEKLNRLVKSIKK